MGRFDPSTPAITMSRFPDVSHWVESGMIEIAMSTVGCPHQTLPEAVALAEAVCCDGIEWRTTGVSGREFACDPFLTDESKVRALCDAAGIEPICLATPVRFDEPISPPIVGRVCDTERSIREAKRAIDLAAQIECRRVRVFCFEKPVKESHASATKRIADRLKFVCDHARNTGVAVVLENGGSYGSAEQLAELIDAVANPLLGAAYDIAIGDLAGDSPEDAIRIFDDRLMLARVRDSNGSGPVQLGRGDRPVEAFVRSLAAAAWSGPIVFEWERAWFAELDPIEQVLPEAVRSLCDWAGLSANQAVA